MTLELRLLGQVSATLDGERLGGLTSPRVLRVLAKVVLDAGRPIHRSSLAFALWLDSTDAQAHTNLRKVLHEIRAGLPDAERYLNIDGHQVTWRDDAPARVDVVELCAALERGDDEAAAAAYGGDLLPGCWDEWVLSERDRLRNEVAGVHERLAAAAIEEGDDEAAVEHATALLAIDPVREAAYRHLMVSHARLGNRVEALRTYHRCAEVLHAELGIGPDPETDRLHDDLRGAAGESDPSKGQSAATTATMVGRGRELKQLDAVWRQALGGEAHLVLVTGEPGIGKSRLVDELVRRVDPPARVARARAYEAAGRLPWGPVVDWLRAPDVHGRLAQLEPGWRDELASLLPELRGPGHRASARPTGAADPDGRRQLFDAVAQALVAPHAPLLLVIDDLQWCDNDTIDLIGFLLTAHPGAPLLIAGTARDEEIDQDHPLASLVTGLTNRRQVTNVGLDRLGRGDTAELAARLADAELSPEVVERLWRGTAGNPLFVIESARAGLHDEPEGAADLSPTIQAIISARLARLSRPAQTAVEVAATIGREFSVEVLLAALDTDEQQVLDALDELWRRRIVGEHGGSYDFTHDRIREVARELVSPVRRRRHHSAVAEALVTLHGAGPGPQSAAVAAHLEEAGRPAEAIEAHRHAAEHALAVCALDEAIASAQRGLALLELLAPGVDRDGRELELRLALGSAVVAREGYGSAWAQEIYERALVLCGRLSREPAPAVLRGLGLRAVMSCRFDRSTELGERLLTADDPIATTEGHYLLGVSAFWRGELAAARHHLEAALVTYRPELGAIHQAHFAQDPHPVCQVRLAVTLLWQGDLTGARAQAAEARQTAVAIDHPTTLGYVLMYTAILATELDDLELLRHEVECGEALWGEQRLGYFMTLGTLFESWLGVCDGRPSAIDEMEGTVARWRQHHESLHLTYGLSVLARARLRFGELDAGLAAVREGLAWGARHHQRYADSLLHRVEGDLLAARGDRVAAASAFGRAVEVARAQGAGWLEAVATERVGALGT